MPTIWDVSPPCDGAKVMDDQVPAGSLWCKGGVAQRGMVSGRSLEGEEGGGRWAGQTHKKKFSEPRQRGLRFHYADINEAAGLVD